MKKSISLLLALSILLVLVACAPKEKPETVVSKAIDSVKNMDTPTAQSYWGADHFGSGGEANATASPAPSSDLDTDKVMKMIVQNLDYKILSSTTDKDTATVKVEITNTDMKQIMSEFITGAMKDAFANAFIPAAQQTTDEETSAKYMQMLTDLMSRENNPKVTNTVDIKLSLVDNAWKIQPNDSAVDAMLGGYLTYTDSLNKTSGGSASNTPKEKISDIRNWTVADVWNKGFCDLSHYYYDGKGSTGETMDAQFTLEQLNKTLEKKSEYDSYMNSLPAEYSEISQLWQKVSGQIDALYTEVQSRGTTVSGQELDTGLYQQYFQAFDNAISGLS